MSKVDNHAKICMELNELYARKNADYGDSFGKSFKEYGLTMSCIRLEDKLNRIKALRDKAAQVADESITDTLMDLANYSIMTLVEMGHGKRIVKGSHDEDFCHGDCLCMTCSKDNAYSSEEACCYKHGYKGKCVVN